MVSEQNNTVIVGGGISGLYSALLAVESGQTNVHVYEGSNRLGGKIQSANLNGQTLNMGAEFIDADHKRLVNLCQRLGLGLQECHDQKNYAFQDASGKMVPDFLQKYQPIARQIIQDREILEKSPNSPYAQQLKSMTLAEYLTMVQKNTPVEEKRDVFKLIWDTVTFNSNRVPMRIVNVAAQAYGSESGQTPNNASAAQFINETSPSPDKFLDSDCGYRVQGGTEAMIHALRAHLEARGVKFHMGEKLQVAQKNPHGGVDLSFASANGTHQVHASKTILALPAYALGSIGGLQSFGLSAAEQQKLASEQYTNSVKFTVAVKPGVQLPSLNMFSAGMQCWTPAPGFVTFLANQQDGVQPAMLVRQHLEAYAKAYGNGKTADELFEMGQGKVAFANPGKAACYASPSPADMLVNDRLYKKVEVLADQGLGVVGTYMPHEGSVGFMECGAAAAERVHARMQEIDQSESLSKTLYQEREVARRASTQMHAHGAIA